MRDIAVMAAEFRAFLAAIDDSDPYLDVDDAAAKLLKFGFGPAPRFSAVIAEQNAARVGYAIYSISFWADTMEPMVLMTDLFVRSDWRGQGVGRMLIKGLVEAGRREECELLMWTVWRKNASAMKFYASLSAKEMDGEMIMTLPIS